MKNWSTYFKRLSHGETQQQAADRIKVADQTTVGRWRRGETTPKDPAVVAAVAQAYGANVLEAFVAAGFLTRDEAGMSPAHGVDFYTLVDDDDSLSDQAKVHLKNQYGLLREASAVQRAAAFRESILADPELDKATKQRLLESFDATAPTVSYTSSVTIVEPPFPKVQSDPQRNLRAVADESELEEPGEFPEG